MLVKIVGIVKRLDRANDVKCVGTISTTEEIIELTIGGLRVD